MPQRQFNSPVISQLNGQPNSHTNSQLSRNINRINSQLNRSTSRISRISRINSQLNSQLTQCRHLVTINQVRRKTIGTMGASKNQAPQGSRRTHCTDGSQNITHKAISFILSELKSLDLCLFLDFGLGPRYGKL